jgi:hypothetical protein
MGIYWHYNTGRLGTPACFKGYLFWEKLSKLTILRVVIWWRLDCTRNVPIVLVLVLIVILHVIVTLLLWHGLLLRCVELNLIIMAISAVITLVCESTSWQAIKLLPIGVFSMNC